MIMKDFGSDKKPYSFDQYDAESPRLSNTNPNADIEYLLSYITLEQSQKLNLTQSSLKKQFNEQSIPRSALSEYITTNSNPETPSTPQKESLVSIIDLGIHLISGIKKIMHKKRPQHGKQKSSTSVSPLQIFKELFFGKQLTSSQTNEYGAQFSLKPVDSMMQKLRIQSEIKILLANVYIKASTHMNSTKQGKQLVKEQQFLLIQSIRQGINKQERSKDRKRDIQIEKRSQQLQKHLNILRQLNQKFKSGSYGVYPQQIKKKISEIWVMIDGIGQYI